MKVIKAGKSVLLCSDETAREHFPHSDLTNALHDKEVRNKIANEIKDKLMEVPSWKEAYDKIPQSKLSQKEQLEELYKLVDKLENDRRK